MDIVGIAAVVIGGLILAGVLKVLRTAWRRATPVAAKVAKHPSVQKPKQWHQERQAARRQAMLEECRANGHKDKAGKPLWKMIERGRIRRTGGYIAIGGIAGHEAYTTPDVFRCGRCGATWDKPSSSPVPA